jgi:hypothetical protein
MRRAIGLPTAGTVGQLTNGKKLLKNFNQCDWRHVWRPRSRATLRRERRIRSEVSGHDAVPSG